MADPRTRRRLTAAVAVLVAVSLVVIALLSWAVGAPWWLSLGLVGVLAAIIVLAYVAS